ncbi:2-amino-4-hydroxy-6-hydroxymethyldihydropteridine diphosphokinase [Salinimonas chungwhensis]|uniref:2-amino-4-hydroxy-6- hydroxymethyldihydropteridine diphosphokinase n=1 Tax=Salinimonas chungwhensis TaxID=265425 RepID=UPI0003738570|nr:2-amino-4-hydroxy-6-hydroxymethyldihydropteridine diphosphokinase [Salinimonas chungwhensis]
MINRILISVGSNIERTEHIRAGVAALKQHFSHVICSSVYESEAVGFDGATFYNLVVCACTGLDVAQVNDRLKQIEKENGRTHTEKKFCSRTLDLDLLTFNDVVTAHPIPLPREEILYNAFVLRPLAELVPEDIHPQVQTTYRVLWQTFEDNNQPLWPIAFDWSDV